MDTSTPLPISALDLTSPTGGLSRAGRAEQTRALLEAAHDCDDTEEAAELRGRAVLINRGVADAIANRYRARGLPLEDLHQVAYEGLTKAVARFDPTLRNDLLTFAVPTIRGEIQRHFRDRGWTIRPPRRIQEVQARASHVVEDLRATLDREPSAQEVADELGIETEDYQEAMAASGCFHPTSLDQPAGGESGTGTLGDLVHDDEEDHEDHEVSEARVMLTPVLRRLPERDRRILYLRFFEDRTQDEIGKDLGVTQMQVSRLLTRILGTVRSEMGVAAT